MRLAPGGGGRRGAVARSQQGFPDPAWRVSTAPRGPPALSREGAAPPACPVSPPPCCHRPPVAPRLRLVTGQERWGFRVSPPLLAPLCGGGRRPEGWRPGPPAGRPGWGIGASRCLRTLVLSPGCWSSQPAQSRLAGDFAPTPPARPTTPVHSQHHSLIAQPACPRPRPAQRVKQVTAEDTRRRVVMEAREGAACLRSCGSCLSGVCTPQPRPGSLRPGASRGRHSPCPPQMRVAVEGWPQKPRGFWFVDAKRVRALRAVQAEGPEGLRPHAESSHVVATRAAHERERAWELWASSKEREDGDPRATSALGFGVDTDRSATSALGTSVARGAHSLCMSLHRWGT